MNRAPHRRAGFARFQESFIVDERRIEIRTIGAACFHARGEAQRALTASEQQYMRDLCMNPAARGIGSHTKEKGIASEADSTRYPNDAGPAGGTRWRGTQP